MTRAHAAGHADDLQKTLSFMSMLSLVRLSGLLDEVRHGLVKRDDGVRKRDDQ